MLKVENFVMYMLQTEYLRPPNLYVENLISNVIIFGGDEVMRVRTS